jgi:hypothetical protein
MILRKRSQQHPKQREDLGGPFPSLLRAQLHAALPVDKFAELIDVGP